MTSTIDVIVDVIDVIVDVMLSTTYTNVSTHAFRPMVDI